MQSEQTKHTAAYWASIDSENLGNETSTVHQWKHNRLVRGRARLITNLNINLSAFSGGCAGKKPSEQTPPTKGGGGHKRSLSNAGKSQ